MIMIELSGRRSFDVHHNRRVTQAWVEPLEGSGIPRERLTAVIYDDARIAIVVTKRKQVAILFPDEYKVMEVIE